MEERSFLHVFHQDEDAIRVAEEAIHADHVGMVEEEGNLYFLDELFNHQSHGLFCDLFDGQKEACLLMDGWKDLAEPALALACA
jgi:hypothetical protein